MPRDSVFVESKRQRENAARFKTPTKVHLQVYDGMSKSEELCIWNCLTHSRLGMSHVLTVYTFHESVSVCGISARAHVTVNLIL